MDWREAKIGAQVNPGWEPLVDALHERMLNLDPDVRVDQVKEKFGGLRYYFTSEYGREEGTIGVAITKLVQMAEARSLTTCEVCGGLAMDGPTPNPRGWLNTLCPEHMEIRDRTGEPVWRIAGGQYEWEKTE